MLKYVIGCSLICLAILAASSGFAQPIALDDEAKKRYSDITQKSLKTPNNLSRTTYHLAQELTANCQSDLEKARSIYVWMTHNISYDMRSFEAGIYPDYRPRAVLNRKEALCGGYAELFAALCIEAELNCKIINGFSKGYGYEPGAKFEVINHAWNAVEIDGEWWLIDATWGATSMNTTSVRNPMREAYFMPEPEQFLLDHLPEIEAWQLVNNPISLAEFEAGPLAIEEKLNTPGNFNFQDSLSALFELDASMFKIEYQKRVSLFNPNNTSADYFIGTEYLYRGLDLLETVHELTTPDIAEKMPALESRIFDLFSEAAFHFSGLKPNSPYFEQGQALLDETIFQKGVCKYEIAHRMIEIYSSYSAQAKRDQFIAFEALVDQYFDQARLYFAQIPIESRYFDDATEYQQEYLSKRFAEL